MASGINGPGNSDVTDDLMREAQHAPQVTPTSDQSSMPNVASEQSEHFQGQFHLGGEDIAEAIEGESSVAAPPNSSGMADNHLSFADLMAHQNKDDLQAATDARRITAYPQSEDKRGNLVSDAYNPTLHMDTSLNEEMEKVFEEEPSVSEPSQLRMDFSNPSMVSAGNYPADEKYGEQDFSSHRRTNVHMYQPMATHLSSRDMKTIQSAHSTKSPEEKSTKRRRHRSSSSSGSLSSSSATKKSSISRETKAKKKKSKKQKKSKRKSLTAKMRDQTTGIPEEDEDESEEESEDDKDEEEEDEDNKDNDGYGRDKEQEERKDNGKSDGDKKEKERKGEQKEKNRTSPGEKGRQKNECDDQVEFIVEGVDGKSPDDSNAAVLFTVGADDAPKATSEANTKDPVVDQPDLPSSLSSSSYSSSSVSESEEKDKLPSLVNIKQHAEEKLKNRRHKHHHHHHHRRKNDGFKIQRRMSGQKLKDLDDQKVPKIIVDDDGLEKEDIDEITSHRFDERVGVRKHLLHRPVKKKKIRTELAQRKVHDRRPHEVFVELDELVSGEWKETARWIKFEEDIEESQTWGKPRVASLSFHSLLELRKTLEKGALMLDLERENLTEVANAVVDEMVKGGQIKGEDQGNVLRVLLSKHKHNALETGLQYNLSRASFSSFFNSQSYAARLNAAGNVSDPEASKLLDTSAVIDMERGQSSQNRLKPTSSQPYVSVASAGGPSAKDIKIMKKIPDGAEASAVLVGNMEHLEQPTMAFVRLASGTPLENVVALPIPVRFLFILLGPTKRDYDYHEIGRAISTLMADREFRDMAYAAESRNDLLRAINEFLDDSIVLPPGQLENPDLLRNISKYQDLLAQRNEKKKRKEIEEKSDGPPPPEEKDPLQRTKRCFGGLIADVKRRYPLYRSDITDAFNLQCLASVIFIYFAALSPVITFGGLLGEKTDGFIGVSEMVLGCCISGCMFGLFSAQPMLVIGSTGPLLVFEEAVFQFAMSSGLPYLAARFWIGLWICIISIIVVAFEGSFLVRYVTRFTQEIFSALISLIFIYETFNKLAKTYALHPLLETYPIELNETELSVLYNCSFAANETWTNGTASNDTKTVEIITKPEPNTALLSTLLMFGTFIIACFLRQFKNSKFLRSSVRRTIGDFGVPIAIIAMLALDLVITDTYTQKLNVPEGLSVTDPSKRGWLVEPLGPPDNPMPAWMFFASAIPALLVFILIFMESHITEVIVSAPERRLKKGSGFHLNLFVIGILNFIMSIFGMPWVCAAAVRSITHTNSLTIMSTTQAPGEKPRIDGIREQRVTVFVVNACLGLSILMQPLLSEIPLAVLFGIFLYMGVTALTGVQFMDRLEMLFMPAKHYPDFSYVKAVRAIRIHIFTIIETICLMILWVVKSTPASIAFPFALVLTIPLRFFLLPRFFTRKELAELDSNDG